MPARGRSFLPTLAPSLFLMLGTVSCHTAADGGSEIRDLVMGSTEDGRPRGAYVMIDPPEERTARIGPLRHRTIFLNRNGGTYRRGPENASTNTSTIPPGTTQVGAWQLGDAAWTQLVTCVRGLYAPYDVTITDIDPGAVEHMEAVVGGTPGQVGLPNNVGGVSPFTSDCSVIERAITYTFADLYGNDVQTICEVVGQESAHALGLDHELNCKDPLTYLAPCGPKSFQNVAAQCGEDTPRACACNGNTQNSHQILMATLGARPVIDDLAPSTTITSPSNRSIVAPGFEVAAIVEDASGVERVELWIDDVSIATNTSAPWTFVTSDQIVEGPHIVEVFSYDMVGNRSTARVDVTVDRQVSDDPDLGGGEPGDGVEGGGNRPVNEQPGYGQDPTLGCAVGAGGAAGGLAGTLPFLALVALVRRRRR